MHHNKYEFIKTLIADKMPVMLEGEAGSGKTTMFMQIAKDLGISFHSITGTQQTSVSNLIGFKTVNGEDSTTQLREAYEFGGMFLIDEFDGMNPNTILALNSIENGFISFPDKVVYAHKNFIICATSNPANEHSAFTGRSKQDAAALDRFIKVKINRDASLELELTSKVATAFADKMRILLKDTGVVSRVITMRDTMRLHKLQGLHSKGLIQENPLDTLIGDNVELQPKLYAFADAVIARDTKLSTTSNVAELFELINKRKG